jgi:hypothetical protein
MKRHAIVAVAVVLLASGPALAQRTIEERMDRQDERLDAGADSGQLTPKEEQKIENRHENIEEKRDAAQADGHVSKREAKKIRRAEDRTGKMIRRERHDDQGK